MMADYTHRKNANGTWDAICMICFRTAATAHTESNLRETETLHRCGTFDQPKAPAVVIPFQRKRVS
jgi:hypothetical protein